MKFTKVGRKARIQCIWKGCSGPAYLCASKDDGNQWWCHCDGCGLSTVHPLDRKAGAFGMLFSTMALATWFGQGGDWIWVFEEIPV